jgi:hypothetical protein
MFGFSEYGAGITVKGPKGGLSTYASVDALEKAIKAKKAKIKKMKAARKKMGFFAPRRRMATAAIIAETRFLRALEAALKTAKAGAKARKVTPKTGAAIPTGAALTAAQIAAIQRMIQQATAQGADADDAEEEAKRRVLPPHLLRAVPRGFFRGVRRAGPRPALPTTQPRFYSPMPGELPGPTRDIDPVLQQRGIDPLAPARDIDPMPLVRGIDPVVGGTTLIPQSGSFTVPPGNLTDVDPDTIMDVEGLDGIVDTVKEYAAKPWVLGLAAVGAFLYFRKSKSAKKNPRHNRRRRARRNRR